MSTDTIWRLVLFQTIDQKRRTDIDPEKAKKRRTLPWLTLRNDIHPG